MKPSNPTDPLAENKKKLDDLIKALHETKFISGMTPEQYKSYFIELKQLRRFIKIIKSDAENLAPAETIEYVRFLVQFAFVIGTYKYPEAKGRARSIFGFFAKSQSFTMSAEDAAALEANDPGFAQRRRELQAESMREKRASAPKVIALMKAIEKVRGAGPSPHPTTEAKRIGNRVNEILKTGGFDPVSDDVIRRRLEKFPRS